MPASRTSLGDVGLQPDPLLVVTALGGLEERREVARQQAGGDWARSAGEVEHGVVEGDPRARAPAVGLTGRSNGRGRRGPRSRTTAGSTTPAVRLGQQPERDALTGRLAVVLSGQPGLARHQQPAQCSGATASGPASSAAPATSPSPGREQRQIAPGSRSCRGGRNTSEDPRACSAPARRRRRDPHPAPGSLGPASPRRLPPRPRCRSRSSTSTTRISRWRSGLVARRVDARADVRLVPAGLDDARSPRRRRAAARRTTARAPCRARSRSEGLMGPHHAAPAPYAGRPIGPTV